MGPGELHKEFSKKMAIPGGHGAETQGGPSRGPEGHRPADHGAVILEGSDIKSPQGPSVAPRTSSVCSGACQTPGPCPPWGREG